MDKRGSVRYRHIGEGAYGETEAMSQAAVVLPATIVAILGWVSLRQWERAADIETVHGQGYKFVSS